MICCWLDANKTYRQSPVLLDAAEIFEISVWNAYILVFSLKPGVKFLGKDLSLPDEFKLLAAPGITHDAISTDVIKHCRDQLNLEPK